MERSGGSRSTATDGGGEGCSSAGYLRRLADGGRWSTSFSEGRRCCWCTREGLGRSVAATPWASRRGGGGERLRRGRAQGRRKGWTVLVRGMERRERCVSARLEGEKGLAGALPRKAGEVASGGGGARAWRRWRRPTRRGWGQGSCEGATQGRCTPGASSCVAPAALRRSASPAERGERGWRRGVCQGLVCKLQNLQGSDCKTVFPTILELK